MLLLINTKSVLVSKHIVLTTIYLKSVNSDYMFANRLVKHVSDDISEWICEQPALTKDIRLGLRKVLKSTWHNRFARTFSPFLSHTLTLFILERPNGSRSILKSYKLCKAAFYVFGIIDIQLHTQTVLLTLQMAAH